MELATKWKKNEMEKKNISTCFDAPPIMFIQPTNLCLHNGLFAKSSDFFLRNSTSVVLCLFYPTSRASAFNCGGRFFRKSPETRLKEMSFLFTNHHMFTLIPGLRIWRLIKKQYHGQFSKRCYTCHAPAL